MHHVFQCDLFLSIFISDIIFTEFYLKIYNSPNNKCYIYNTDLSLYTCVLHNGNKLHFTIQSFITMRLCVLYLLFSCLFVVCLFFCLFVYMEWQVDFSSSELFTCIFGSEGVSPQKYDSSFIRIFTQYIYN